MTRLGVMLALVLAGCSASDASDVGSSSAHEAVIKVYDSEMTFSTPRSCDIYMQRRIADEAARTVEYDALVGGHAASIVYSVVKDDPFPLQVDLYDGRGVNTFSLLAADHSLQILGADGTLLRSVDGYDGNAADARVQNNGSIADADGLTLLGCALADRTFSDVPAFLRNLTSGGLVPGQTDVGQTMENAQPILPDWKGSVSLLGAFWLGSGCLTADGWQCDCWQSMDDPVIGPVAGWCS